MHKSIALMLGRSRKFFFSHLVSLYSFCALFACILGWCIDWYRPLICHHT